MLLSKVVTRSSALVVILSAAVILRFVGLANHPPLYTDEASLGYSAYSILRTGADEFGQKLPVSLRSFGDYKPPLSAYLMIPGIAAFGLSTTTIRLPSAITGIATIVLVYLLVKLLTGNSALALGSAFVLTFSPWHIHQSRMAMLVGNTLFFFVAGVYTWLKGARDPRWYILSAISFALSIYGYYGMRVVVPLMLGALVVLYRREIVRGWRWAGGSAVVFIVLLLPLTMQFLGNSEVLFGRARHVSLFADEGVQLRLWEAASTDGQLHPLVSRVFHNKLIAYAEDAVRRFFSHFEIEYLFVRGDRAEPFEVPGIGLLWLFEFPLVLVGIHALRKHKKLLLLALFWLGLHVLPAALTFVTPASNRSFGAVVPLAIFTGAGVAAVVSKKRMILPLILLLWLAGLVYAAKQYIIVLPRDIGPRVYSASFVGADKLAEYRNRYDRIVISERARLPYVHLLVRYQYDPWRLQQELQIKPGVDQFGYEHVDRFGNIQYRQDVLWERERITGTTLYVAAPQEGLPRSEYRPRVLTEIRYESGDQAMRFIEVQPMELK